MIFEARDFVAPRRWKVRKNAPPHPPKAPNRTSGLRTRYHSGFGDPIQYSDGERHSYLLTVHGALLRMHLCFAWLWPLSEV